MPWQKQASNSVEKLAAKLEAELITHQLDNVYIDLIKNPKYGYGSAFNPCIDCHIFMFKIARKYLNELKADFVFTGEVLAQRPMSQMRDKLTLSSPLSKKNKKLFPHTNKSGPNTNA